MEEAYKEWQQLEEQTGVKLVKYDHRDDYDDDDYNDDDYDDAHTDGNNDNW